MKARIFAALFLAVVLGVSGLHLFPCPDVVLTTVSSGQQPLGTVEIPSAGVRMALYPAHVDTCCGILLWNGGIIHAGSAEAFAEIDLGDRAIIEPEGLVLECVSIERCVTIGGWLVGWRGIIRPGGDVLIVSGGRVYRFIIL